MLDVRHQGRFPLARGDKHLFIGGEICGHNVVIATWPKGHQYGVGSAAELASDVKRLFRKIWFALLVGIAAGIPKLNMADTAQQRDIRLGDVLVAIPDQRSSGIVQYDSAKYLSSDEGVNTVLTGKQAESEGVIRATIQFLEFTSPVPFQDGNECARYLEHLQGQHPSDKFTCPAQQHDILHTAISKDNETVRIIVEREPRPESVRSLVWFGRIGSGNSLVKSARTRDRLRDEHNLIGLEMEAAGIMNILPAGVIRGVCDYADREKDKRWQGYAAGAAAAYAKSILNSTPPLKEETADQRTRHDSAPMMKPSRRRTLIHRSTPLLQDDNESDTDWNAAAHDADTEERVIAERIHGMSYTRDGTLPSPKYSDRHSHTRDSLRKTSHTIQPNSSTRKFGEVPRNQRYQVVSSHSSGAGASKYQSPTVVDEPSPDSKMATSPASEYGTPLRQIKTRGTTRTQVVETGDSSINATTSPGQAIPKRPESDLGQLRDKQLHDIFRDASPCHQHNEAPRISSPQPTDSGNQERSETVFADDDGIRVTPIHAVVERPHGNEDSSATSISVQPMPSPTTKETIVLDTSMDEDRKSIVGFYGNDYQSPKKETTRERSPTDCHETSEIQKALCLSNTTFGAFLNAIGRHGRPRMCDSQTVGTTWPAKGPSTRETEEEAGGNMR
ncbi:Hypothetical protein D9617_47g010770 [Elsinoe fawcettii]|nr:Hypothetical protein D9617_47g010770 [Elsinoe fawcettii]